MRDPLLLRSVAWEIPWPEKSYIQLIANSNLYSFNQHSMVHLKLLAKNKIKIF